MKLATFAPWALLALIFLRAPAYAQVLLGDLLLNSAVSPDVLVHYRPDGTVVQTTGSASGTVFEGAAILPNGNGVTTHRGPTNTVRPRNVVSDTLGGPRQ